MKLDKMEAIVLSVFIFIHCADVYALDTFVTGPNRIKLVLSGLVQYCMLCKHRLVEEFMLMANMAVAHKINAAHPNCAVLRRHPPPKVNQMDKLVSEIIVSS